MVNQVDFLEEFTFRLILYLQFVPIISVQWSISTFIPIKSKKFEFRNLDNIIRFSLKNDSENPKYEVT